MPKKFRHPKICCNDPEIWTKLLYHRVMHPKDGDRIANSIDPDQTAPLIWVGTVCSDRSVRKRRIITVALAVPPLTLRLSYKCSTWWWNNLTKLCIRRLLLKSQEINYYISVVHWWQKRSTNQMENKALLIFELELWTLGLEFVIFIEYWWNVFSYMQTLNILFHSWGYSVQCTEHRGGRGGNILFHLTILKKTYTNTYGCFSHFIF